MEVRLSLETFEKAVNMLELMHFDAVKAWWEEQQSGEQQGAVAASCPVACAAAICSPCKPTTLSDPHSKQRM
jgi:hypothetical protein